MVALRPTFTTSQGTFANDVPGSTTELAVAFTITPACVPT
jgi:hypothetical protein